MHTSAVHTHTQYKYMTYVLLFSSKLNFLIPSSLCANVPGRSCLRRSRIKISRSSFIVFFSFVLEFFSLKKKLTFSPSVHPSTSSSSRYQTSLALSTFPLGAEGISFFSCNFFALFFFLSFRHATNCSFVSLLCVFPSERRSSLASRWQPIRRLQGTKCEKKRKKQEVRDQQRSS